MTKDSRPVPNEPAIGWKVANVANAGAMLNVMFDGPMAEIGLAADDATRSVRRAIAVELAELESSDAFLELERVRASVATLDDDAAAVDSQIAELQANIQRQIRAGGEPSQSELQLAKLESTRDALARRRPTMETMLESSEMAFDQLRANTIRSTAMQLRNDAANQRRDAIEQLARIAGPALTAIIAAQAALLATSDDAVKHWLA